MEASIYEDQLGFDEDSPGSSERSPIAEAYGGVWHPKSNGGGY